MSKHRFFTSRPAPKFSKPRAFQFETLEVRELMAVMKGNVAAAAPPAKGGAVQTAQVGTANTGNAGKVTMPPNFLVPILNSNPGAPATLYLDFNGHYQHETVLDDTFGPTGGVSDFYTSAYDTAPATAQDPANLTPVELEEIRAIWAAVAEDYAPFNINVTTVEPSSFSHSSQNLRVAIGGTDFRSGKDSYGVSDHNAFNEEGSPNIVHVFNRSKNGSVRNVQDVADAASHEAGHAFGLLHQSTFNSTGGLVDEYRKGDKQRAPLMGLTSAGKRATWSVGTSGTGSSGVPGTTFYQPSHIFIQDDMAILAGSENGFGYRTDDYSGNFATAAALRTENTAGLFASGIIGSTADKDMFRFETGGGAISIKLTLPAHGTINLGNLDATLKLYDSQQRLVAADSDPTLLASISKTLPAGTYYLEVGSYGNYGDVGQYKLAVTEKAGAKVVSSTYESLSATQGGVWVTFNEPINPLTFTTADVKIDGGAAGAGVLSVEAVAGDPKKFLVKVTKPKNAATPQMSISVGPQINDLFGNAMDQNGNGAPGEAADYYFANLGLGVAPPAATTAALSPKKTTSPRKF